MYTEQRSLEIISEEYIIVPSVNEGKTIKIGEGQGIGLFCLFGMWACHCVKKTWS